MFSILKFPPRVLVYSTPSIISRKMAGSERKDTNGPFLRYTGKQGKTLGAADTLVLALPNLLLVFQISRHVKHVMSLQIFFVEAPRYQTNRPIYF